MGKEEPTIILGIDPGTQVTGYGVISVTGRDITALDYGCIRPPTKMKLTDRYLVIYNAVSELVERFCPHALSIETQFVRKNPQSALKLGMARGVAIVAAKQRDVSIYEYSPAKAKLSVVGTGRASKEQVQGMVQRLLSLPALPEPEDAADALALAICHSNSGTSIAAQEI